MTSNDFVSANHVLQEVATLVNDTSFRKGIPKGRFLSWIQDAHQSLCMETKVFQYQDDQEIPQSLQMIMPKNVFNIREIYVYSGSLCNPMVKKNVYHKRQFNNNYKGDGYTAKIKDDGTYDTFNVNDRDLWEDRLWRPKKYYYNTQTLGNETIIMLSRECLDFSYVRIIYNSMGVIVGEIPSIPRFFERAVVDYVKMRYFEAMKSRDVRAFRSLWADAKNDYENPVNGSLKTAKNFVKSMDNSVKESMEEYISNMYHK